MLSAPKKLMQSGGALLVLALIMLFPATARLQEQNAPPAPQQEQPNEAQAPQKPGELIIPEGKATTQPETLEQNQTAVPGEDKETGEPEEPETASAQTTGAPYSIKKGDTLWDISNAFLKDPFLWPFIWKANPYVVDPDLIYPDNKLIIPNLAPIERALKEPVPQKQVVEKKITAAKVPQPELQPELPSGTGIASAGVKAPPAPVGEETATEERSKLIIPEEQPVPIIDKYAMLSAGFVNQEEYDGRIVGAPEDAKTIYSYDDLVYVTIPAKQTVNIGDKFLIYAPLHDVQHPILKKTRFGRLIAGLGILQITAKDASGKYTAKITLSFDTIERNNMLTPYQEPALVFDPAQKKAKDISGYILEVTDRRAINGQTHFVYLDRGSMDGVEPADRFVVYADTEAREPRKIIGEVQVFIVKERSSTAVVRRSTDTLSRGERVEFKK